MGDTIVIETPVATVLEVSGLQGPQGVPGASQADVLTVQGDLLYRGASAAQRLGIGTAGQILKVNSGGTAPEWGAAPAPGVTSVNGDTGAVTITPASIDAAESNHDHQPSDIYCDAAKVTAATQSAGEPNGVYFRDGSDNGKATYKSAAGYSIFWDDAEGEWVLGNVSQSQKYFIGSQDTTYPWQVSIAWTLGAQGTGTVPTVGQATLTDYQLNAAQDSVSTRVPKSGNATSTEVVLGSDTRLTNSRVPTVHAASHGPSGSDPLFNQDLNTTDSVTFADLSVTSSFDAGSFITSGTVNVQSGALFVDSGATAVEFGVPIIFANGAEADSRTNLGLEIGTDVAAASHTHGNLTNDGKLGSTAGLPVVTTTAGAVTTLALGTANQVLRVNSGATGVEFADPAASGVTGAASSASDVLGVSGANITGVDAGSADRLVFWDDSASKLTYLEAGSGLSISGTTLTATASGGSKTYAVFTAEHNQPPSTAFATLDTRNSIAVLDFDAATDENAVFVGIMPEAASLGSGLIVRLHWMATSATSGNVRWGVQFERSNTDLDADSFDTAVEATAATNGTSGIITTTAITVTTIDGITAGDVFRLKVFRNADDATNDTMTGDAELVAVEVRSAA